MTRTDAITISWRDSRAISLTLEAINLDVPNATPISTDYLFSQQELTAKSVSNNLIGFFHSGTLHDGQRLALQVTLKTAEATPDDVLSSTFVAVTINEFGSGDRLELSPRTDRRPHGSEQRRATAHGDAAARRQLDKRRHVERDDSIRVDWAGPH